MNPHAPELVFNWPPTIVERSTLLSLSEFIKFLLPPPIKLQFDPSPFTLLLLPPPIKLLLTSPLNILQLPPTITENTLSSERLLLNPPPINEHAPPAWLHLPPTKEAWVSPPAPAQFCCPPTKTW